MAKFDRNLAVLFSLSALFFAWQHYESLSWDFSVYVLNAKHWLGAGEYFEVGRPPLMPFILAMLSPFGWVVAEYLYILLACLTYLFSSVALADSLRARREIFYLFSLSPWILAFGLSNGTEILSIALLSLFLSSLIRK